MNRCFKCNEAFPDSRLVCTTIVDVIDVKHENLSDEEGDDVDELESEITIYQCAQCLLDQLQELI